MKDGCHSAYILQPAQFLLKILEKHWRRILGRRKSFLWDHWYPCFGLPMTSTLGFFDVVFELNSLLLTHLWCQLRFTVFQLDSYAMAPVNNSTCKIFVYVLSVNQHFCFFFIVVFWYQFWCPVVLLAVVQVISVDTYFILFFIMPWLMFNNFHFIFYFYLTFVKKILQLYWIFSK